MLKGVKYFISLSLLSALLISPLTSHSAEEGLGKYSCSLTVTLNGQLVVKEVKDQSNLFKVAKDESDWTAYREVFSGLNKTIKFPMYFTLRLVPNSKSGTQDLDLEISVQNYNRFKASKMEPMTSVLVPAKYGEAALRYQTPSNYKVNFYCSKN